MYCASGAPGRQCYSRTVGNCELTVPCTEHGGDPGVVSPLMLPLPAYHWYINMLHHNMNHTSADSRAGPGLSSSQRPTIVGDRTWGTGIKVWLVAWCSVYLSQTEIGGCHGMLVARGSSLRTRAHVRTCFISVPLQVYICGAQTD